MSKEFFALKKRERIEDKTVILGDDVYTTGNRKSVGKGKREDLGGGGTFKKKRV